MSNEKQDKPGESEPGRPKFNYFVDAKKYDWDSPTITGKEIKNLIPGFNLSFELFLEGRGDDADRKIVDSETVDLAHAPHLYTAPPATFGLQTVGSCD